MQTINLKVLASCELKKIATECYDILEERKKEKKAELIEAFRVAFYNLREAGVEVLVGCECCGDEIPFEFDNLYFESDTFRVSPFSRKSSINRLIFKCHVCFTQPS
jgi:hypothetical protein